MQPVNTSTAAGGSNETLGIVGSSHGTLERENNSHDLYPEGDSLNVLQPNLEEDVSGESLLANKKLRAACWKDFELTMLADGTCKALCKHCKKDLVAGNRAGTSHLNYHIKVCPKNQSSKRRKFGSPSVEIPVFDQQRSRDDFARMVLAHGYSFNMAEHYYTRTFLYNLQPSFKLVHRTSLKDDCMKIYDEEKLRVYQIFDKQQSRFSITSDMWTHTEMSGYMSITAHYIDDEWNLHKRLIGFAHVEIPHTGEHIAKEIISRLYPWNLDRRLFSLALDNCTVNNVVIRDVKKFLLSKKVLHLDGSLFHIRCAAHVLNLIVQDGLAVISSAIGKIQESVKYVNGSTLRKEKFKLLAQQVNAPNLSLKSDTPTRWNSTFLMLERAMKFRAAFDRLHECHGSYKFVPSEEDWQHIECVSDCLKVFYDVTKRVSCTKYPTLSLYFNDLSGIYLLLREWKFSANAFVASMAVPMVEKFEKYWDNANKLLEIATILDPRYKMKSIEYYYGLLYDSFVAELRVESARKSFSELFGEYARQPSRISSQASTTRNFEVEVASSTEPSSSLVATRLGLEKFIYESNSSQHSKSDLEVYLEDPAVEESGYHAVLKLPKSFESNRCKYIPTDGRSSWTSTYASSGGRTAPAATTLRRRWAASCRAGTRGPSGQARMGPGSRRELRVGGAGLRRGLAAGAWCCELAGGVGVAS